jgi:hypothetical protein
MANSETTVLEMLKQIDRKLDVMLEKLSEAGGRFASNSRSARAKHIAALTPAVRQTDAVEVLHEDRSR